MTTTQLAPLPTTVEAIVTSDDLLHGARCAAARADAQQVVAVDIAGVLTATTRASGCLTGLANRIVAAQRAFQTAPADEHDQRLMTWADLVDENRLTAWQILQVLNGDPVTVEAPR